MADYGLKVTLPGSDISSSNVQDYTLWSKYDVGKTYLWGTGSLSFSSEADTETDHTIVNVTHNLGYKPFCIMYWSLNGSSYSGSFWILSQGSPHFCTEEIYMNASSTNFTIVYHYINNGGGDGQTGISSYSFNVKYYLFIERGEP